MPRLTPKVARQQLQEYVESGSQARQDLVDYVTRLFPRLRDQAEDLVQTVFEQVWEVLQQPSASARWRSMQRRLEHYLALFNEDWPRAWVCYLCRLLKWRAIDLLRLKENEALVYLAGLKADYHEECALDPPDNRAPPDLIVAEAERRNRQKRLLSGILSDFVDWCESAPRKGGLIIKEVYERRLHDQNPDAIAAAMGLSRNHVDVCIKRARDWLSEQIRKGDVDKSVFVTLIIGVPRRITAAPESGQFARFVDVLDFVIREMGALCPSEERLWQYAQNPDSQDLSDIRYHVRDARCQLCLAELEQWAAKPPAQRKGR